MPSHWLPFLFDRILLYSTYQRGPPAVVANQTRRVVMQVPCMLLRFDDAILHGMFVQTVNRELFVLYKFPCV